jgi:hypothetical protein
VRRSRGLLQPWDVDKHPLSRFNPCRLSGAPTRRDFDAGRAGEAGTAGHRMGCGDVYQLRHRSKSRFVGLFDESHPPKPAQRHHYLMATHKAR